MTRSLIVFLALAGTILGGSGPIAAPSRAELQSTPVTSIWVTGDGTFPSYPLGEKFSFTAGYEGGVTTYDYQQNGAMGNRVAVDDSGNVHIAWMHSDDTTITFPNRNINYNFWDKRAKAFAFGSEGVKASGELRAGYTTCGVMPDGRGVIAFHEAKGDSIWSAVVVDSFPGRGAFGKPVAVDKSIPVMWPHMVVGSDGTIHVAGHTNDSSATARRIIYYSRSTDGGLTFSPWQIITDDAGDDPAIALSKDDKKVCIAWMSQVPINTGGKDYNCGHINIIESTNGGVSWGSPKRITEGRYPASIINTDTLMFLFANCRNIDCAYDNVDNVLVAYTEGWHKWDDGTYHFPRMWGRTMLWNAAGGFSCPTAGHPMFYNVDTLTGDTLWVFDSLGMWGVASPVEEEHGGQYGPQLAVMERYGHQYIILTWGGQYDSLDLSAGGTANGDIYGSISDDNGNTWCPLRDYSSSLIGTVWEHVTNITNTHAPGAGVGSTPDEDYHTSWPWIGSDGNLHITYIKDLFSGSVMYNPLCPSYDIITHNPVMYLRYLLDIEAIEEKPQPDEAPLAFINATGCPPLELRLSAPLPENGVLRVRNVLGQTVKEIEVPHGTQTLTWDGLDNYGRAVPSGVYFIEVRTKSMRGWGKVALVR